MHITNKFGLPAPLVRAVSRTRHESDDDPNSIRVSQVVMPIQIRALLKKHDDKIEEDAADRIFALLGTLLHDNLEQNAKDLLNCTTEEGLTVEILGWKVTGHYDLAEAELTLEGETLTDWKLTSVYAMKDKELKPDWAAQVNVYAELIRLAGKTVSKAQIVAIGRDWSKLRAEREPDYPQQQVIVRNVPLWERSAVHDYLKSRVALHQKADREEIWPDCTPEERWARPDIWAIHKRGNKRATKLCYAPDEADRWLNRNIADSHLHNYRVEHRPGEPVRCESYCPVSKFCPQWAKLKTNSSNPSETEK